MRHDNIIIIGSGVAGLTCGYELVKNGYTPLILDSGDRVGGIARTDIFKGYCIDIGGHRFYTKLPEIEAIWHELLGSKFMLVNRLSRIYYKQKYYNYPIELHNAISNLGIGETLGIIKSYLLACINKTIRAKEPINLEEYLIDNFGDKLYRTFFKNYTEKVWGEQCVDISAEWGEQRIKGLCLQEIAKKALGFGSSSKSLISQFHYPQKGVGQMWETMAHIISKAGGTIKLNSPVQQIHVEENKVTGVLSNDVYYQAEHIVSTMSLRCLINSIVPQPPFEVVQSANSLGYRDFLIVCLIVDSQDIFPDNWIYIHDQGYKVGRIQNFKNWSKQMVVDDSKSCIGLEYFCNIGDSLYSALDEELIELATTELDGLGLCGMDKVLDGYVIRQPKAYPVYANNYEYHLSVIKSYLSGITGLQTIGRNGLHKYNNMDNSMLTGLLAARNIMGSKLDVWNVNTERSYYETFKN